VHQVTIQLAFQIYSSSKHPSACSAPCSSSSSEPTISVAILADPSSSSRRRSDSRLLLLPTGHLPNHCTLVFPAGHRILNGSAIGSAECKTPKGSATCSGQDTAALRSRLLLPAGHQDVLQQGLDMIQQ
jgi:hypothetical protein